MKTMDRLLLLVIAGVLAGTYYFTNSHVPSPVEQKSVSVVGVGEASATPDQLTITFSVSQTGATTQATQKLVNRWEKDFLNLVFQNSLRLKHLELLQIMIGRIEIVFLLGIRQRQLIV
mgnify:CR=1 FL=1